VVTGLLRQELGFEGLVFTDDMNMKAISGRVAPGRAAVDAVAAGCDALLLCGTDIDSHAAALEALIHAIEQGELPADRVNEAIGRQAAAKARFSSVKPVFDEVSGEVLAAPMSAGWKPLPPVRLRNLIGRDEHQAIADKMRQFA
jgi:beta-N-acetylhexosaminidase